MRLSHFGESFEDSWVLSNDCKGEALGGELFFQSPAMNYQLTAVYCKGEDRCQNQGQDSAEWRDEASRMSKPESEPQRGRKC